MHVLRTTLFTAPDHAMHVVVREEDVKSFGEVLANPTPEALLVHEVFEMPEASITQATGEAMSRAMKRAQTEMNMAISFFWNAQQLERLSSTGVLANPAPAPYGEEEMRQVLLALSRHPAYKGQVIVQRTQDDKICTLTSNGEVRVDA